MKGRHEALPVSMIIFSGAIVNRQDVKATESEGEGEEASGHHERVPFEKY